MTQRTCVPGEAAETTHARLSATALAEHANACAVADAFLRDDMTPGPESMPPDLVLTRTGAGRSATIGAGTPDERRFTDHEALRVYVKTCLVRSLTVRREGWTRPSPEDSRIEPDTARLLLHSDKSAGKCVTDIVARIGMDRSLDAPHLRYQDGTGRMQPFNHRVHGIDERGVCYVAGLFTA